MAYEASFDGIDEISEMIATLGEQAEATAARGLYMGAGAMAKEITQQVNNIRTDDFSYAHDGSMRLPSPEEKAILQETGAMGIAKFDKNGSEVNTSVGFNNAGYADVAWNHMYGKTRTNYKGKGEGRNQKPIGVIANAINSGTSFMKKQPFVRQALSNGKGKAENAIRAEIERIVDEITK